MDNQSHTCPEFGGKHRCNEVPPYPHVNIDYPNEGWQSRFIANSTENNKWIREGGLEELDKELKHLLDIAKAKLLDVESLIEKFPCHEFKEDWMACLPALRERVLSLSKCMCILSSEAQPQI